MAEREASQVVRQTQSLQMTRLAVGHTAAKVSSVRVDARRNKQDSSRDMRAVEREELKEAALSLATRPVPVPVEMRGEGGAAQAVAAAPEARRR